MRYMQYRNKLILKNVYFANNQVAVRLIDFRFLEGLLAYWHTVSLNVSFTKVLQAVLYCMPF